MRNHGVVLFIQRLPCDYPSWSLQLEPASWDLQTSFLIECRDVFDSDADETAHPLHIDLSELSSLADVFDLTSYVKGNCMAHMIYHFLGERIFLSSVRRYIHTYYYRSANQTDLWSAFQAEIDGANGLPASSGLRMKDIMRTWTYQAGFPVLHVRQNRETGAIEFTQVRPMFIADRSTQAFLHLSSLYRRRQIIYRWNVFTTILIIVIPSMKWEKNDVMWLYE